VHTCFVVSEEVYEPWKAYLAGRGVEILQEVTWPRGLSFYFRDPDGNLLEIANADIWPP
jgi:catechol 2,3-dioxygenase-like lactoylglutathione lyase family enzyme